MGGLQHMVVGLGGIHPPHTHTQLTTENLFKYESTPHNTLKKKKIYNSFFCLKLYILKKKKKNDDGKEIWKTRNPQKNI